MSPPKRLYTAERIIYHRALLTCLHCGDLLVMWNDLAWDKTVQTLNRRLAIATPHPAPGLLRCTAIERYCCKDKGAPGGGWKCTESRYNTHAR